MARKSSGNEKKKEFSEGDVFYSLIDNQYHFYKLLKIDKEIGAYHVLCYKPLSKMPSWEDLKKLEVHIYHVPVDKHGFDNALIISREPPTANDLIGYHEYLRHTSDKEFIVKTATEYYQLAYKLSDLKKHELAINEYSKAIDLVPQFFEAIDNRAFCKMDLGRWDDAIEDFKISLTVKPNSVLAEFSIGECYLRLHDGKRAKEQFEKAIAIDPTDQLSHDFLKKAIEMIGEE